MEVGERVVLRDGRTGMVIGHKGQQVIVSLDFDHIQDDTAYVISEGEDVRSAYANRGTSRSSRGASVR